MPLHSRAESRHRPSIRGQRLVESQSQHGPIIDAAPQQLDLRVHSSRLKLGVSPPPPTMTRISSTADSTATSMVEFVENDPEDPMNWHWAWKSFCTFVQFLNFFVVAFNSAIVTVDFEGVALYFGTGKFLALMTFAFYVWGFGFGPLLWSPISEVYGRKWVSLAPLLIGILLTIACAFAPSITVLLPFRFLSGVFFGAPLTICGAVIAAIWSKEDRNRWISAYSIAPLLGLVIGSLFGGVLTHYFPDWHNLYYTQIAVSLIGLVLQFFVPETHGTTILRRRLRRLAKENPGRKYVLRSDNRPLKQLLKQSAKDSRALFLEPILWLVTMMVSLVFGLVYMSFISNGLVFVKGRGYTPIQAGLCQLPLGVSFILSPLLQWPMLICIRRYRSKSAKKTSRDNAFHQRFDAGEQHELDDIRRSIVSQQMVDKTPPEDVLLLAALSSIFIPAAYIVLAQISTHTPITSPPPGIAPYPIWDPSLAVPVVGQFILGQAVVPVLNGAALYLQACYPEKFASALAVQTAVRSIFGGACILFTEAMYLGLGIEHGMYLLAGVASIITLTNWYQWAKGANLRIKSDACFKDDILGEAAAAA